MENEIKKEDIGKSLLDTIPKVQVIPHNCCFYFFCCCLCCENQKVKGN